MITDSCGPLFLSLNQRKCDISVSFNEVGPNGLLFKYRPAKTHRKTVKGLDRSRGEKEGAVHDL